MSQCPIDGQWDHTEPCPICGALGPWYESEDCVSDCVTVVDVGDDLHQVLGDALKQLAH